MNDPSFSTLCTRSSKHLQSILLHVRFSSPSQKVKEEEKQLYTFSTIYIIRSTCCKQLYLSGKIAWPNEFRFLLNSPDKVR